MSCSACFSVLDHLLVRNHTDIHIGEDSGNGYILKWNNSVTDISASSCMLWNVHWLHTNWVCFKALFKLYWLNKPVLFALFMSFFPLSFFFHTDSFFKVRWYCQENQETAMVKAV